MGIFDILNLAYGKLKKTVQDDPANKTVNNYTEVITSQSEHTIDRAKFYQEYRKVFGTVKQSNINCLEAVFDVFDKNKSAIRDLEKKAYMLATIRHEVGADMIPIVENMCYTEQRIREVWPSRPEAIKFGSNKSIGKKCDPAGLGNSVYANRLGNGRPSSGDGYRYRGRGIGAQFTGKVNYIKFSKLFNIDLVGNPELAVDLNLGAKILYKGSVEGLFTGKKLGDYITASNVDYKNARRVVNADTARNGQRIANDAIKFYNILNKSRVV